MQNEAHEPVDMDLTESPSAQLFSLLSLWCWRGQVSPALLQIASF